MIKKHECVGHVQKRVGKRLRAVRTVNIFKTINILILRQNYNLGTVQGEDCRKEEGGRAEDEAEGGAGEVLSRYFQGPRPRPGSRQGEGARLPRCGAPSSSASLGRGGNCQGPPQRRTHSIPAGIYDYSLLQLIYQYCVPYVCTSNGTATPYANMAMTWQGWSRQSGLCSTTPSLLTRSLSIIVVLMVLTVGANTIVHWQMVNRHHHITQNSQLSCSRLFCQCGATYVMKNC